MAARRGDGSALAALLGPPSSSEDSEEPESGGEALAQALIDAVKGGDASGVEMAFQDLYDHCAAKSSAEPEME